MLEFTEVFNQGHVMYYGSNNIATIMKCKNIVFDRAHWFGINQCAFDDTNFMVHLIDNVVDIDVCDYGKYFTLFSKVLVYSNNPSSCQLYV